MYRDLKIYDFGTKVSWVLLIDECVADGVVLINTSGSTPLINFFHLCLKLLSC